MKIEALRNLVTAIPTGRCTSYSAVGRALPNPVSGLLVGKWMASRALEGNSEVPWWRVCAKDGTLVISKRDPVLGIRQRKQLEQEGVTFDPEGRVEMTKFFWDDWA